MLDAELRTGELLLRAPREDEAEDALKLLRDPEVVRWNPAAQVVDVETARAWCRSGAAWDRERHYTFSVLDADTGRLLGNLSLFHLDHDHGTASIGYRVAPWARRRGVGTRAVAAVTDWAFTDLQLFRVELRHATANIGSCRVADRAGFTFEATLRQASATPDGSRFDEHLHARLRTDPVPTAT